ncbi:APC family permease [Arthrobacter sp. CAN_C5]|uniref:APC family permease n=1 Tax=Arthrobacter sp. CAN_C5 TaxID=2760706 RepID=UPI001AEB38AA|nr:amino acid permease [Arthrobacter sp. CAN_C5]MBP2216986.1 amino acid efflux transporter [Arthrobacter sp. CAN_C5]
MNGHLRLPGAIALAITTVVGSGALVLPGIAYSQVGESALMSWLLAALITVPLLLIFATLGSTFPGAGGVAGFLQQAFGRSAAAGTEVLLLGTFGLGVPAIALTGGAYATAMPLLEAVPVGVVSVALVGAAAAVVYVGAKFSTRVQITLAVVLTAVLIALGLVALIIGVPSAIIPDLTNEAINSAFMGIGIVFFAFAGWEMISFTTEEYANPKRDFPRVVAVSFLIVTVMYFLLAWGLQSALPGGGAEATTAPVQALAALIDPRLAAVISVFGVMIIFANLVGAIWGASRLVMSSAREQLLPRPLAKLSTGKIPRNAVLACAAGFILVIIISQAGLIPVGTMLEVAGKNFFLLYLMCAAAYLVLFPGARRIFGVAVAAALAVLAALSFGPLQLAYAGLLFAAGASISRARLHRSPAATPENAAAHPGAPKGDIAAASDTATDPRARPRMESARP